MTAADGGAPGVRAPEIAAPEVGAPEAEAAPGRRRAASRHRSSWSGPLPPWLAWLLRRGLPLVSLVPALLATAVVQGFTPMRLAEGVARFAVAGADLVLRPGALDGYSHPVTTPTVAWAGYGLLERALLGGVAQPVLAATHAALLVVALASVGLLWLLARRLGVSGLAAGAAAAVLGIAPVAVTVHDAPTAANLAALGLLGAALLLTVPRSGALAAVGAGILAGAAVLAEPVALAVVPALAVLLVARAGATPSAGAVRPRALAAGIAFGATAALGLLALLVLAARPSAGATSAALGAIGAGAAAARTLPSAGGAGGALWLAVDPLSLLVVAVAVIVAATLPRGRVLAATAALLLAISVWPLGAEPLAVPGMVLPVAALAIALVVDRCVVALGSPTFLVSLIGSGWLMGVAALLVVAVAAWVAGLLAPGRDLAQQLTASADWVRTGVPDRQVVLVDVAAWPDAARATRASVGWYAPPVTPGAVRSSAPWSSVSWIVADPALRVTATGAAAAALHRTVVIRSYGSDDGAVQVRALPGAAVRGGAGATPTPAPGASASPLPTPTSSAAALAAEARRTTGGQLAKNPRIVLRPADRALLTSGAVDSRITLALGQLAAQHSITVARFPEGSGDVPGVRRRVVIGAVDDVRVPGDPAQTGVLLRYLSGLRAPYAPQALGAGGPGVMVTFSANPTFVPAP